MLAKVTLGLLLLAAAAADGDLDPRSLSQGIVIANLTTGYADQPYCVVNGRDGSWLCTVTHGDGTEGASGEKVITTRSTDKGATWTAAIEVEPQAPSEYAYSTLLGAGAADSRVFVLWVENSDNVTELPGVGPITRTDMLGHYWLKWSDDGGASWSDERVEVPLRATKIDRENSVSSCRASDESTTHAGRSPRASPQLIATSRERRILGLVRGRGVERIALRLVTRCSPRVIAATGGVSRSTP